MKIAASLRTGWWGPGLVLVLSLVAVGMGHCVFDGHDHDSHGPALDLCIIVLNVTFASALLAGPLLEGWAVDPSPVSVPSVWTTVLAPPPRSL
jgi:hypothetical protein